MSRTENPPIIRISTEKNYIIAKAFVKVKNKPDYQVEIRQGYKLYYIFNTDGGKLYQYSESNGQGETVGLIGDKNCILGKKCDHDYVTLYWMKTNASIKIPFGFGADEKLRGNGCVTLKIDNTEGNTKGLEKFLHHFPVINWESDYVDGITYQYATEYFIDSAHKQNGFSLALRDDFKALATEAFVKDTSEINKESLKNAINDYLGKQSYGLIVDNNISYSSFEGKKESEI